MLAVGVGVLVGWLFVRRQRRLDDPLIDVRPFRVTTFNASLVTNVIAISVAFGYFLFVAQYLQLLLGMSPLQAGWWSLPSSAGFVVGSNLAPRFVHRIRPATVLTPAQVTAAGGLVVLTQVGAADGPGLVVVGSVIISLALAPVLTLTTELVVGSAPAERAGAASGIAETAAEFGGALGIAILGSIGTAVCRSALAGRPSGRDPRNGRWVGARHARGCGRRGRRAAGHRGAVLLEAARIALWTACRWQPASPRPSPSPVERSRRWCYARPELQPMPRPGARTHQLHWD